MERIAVVGLSLTDSDTEGVEAMKQRTDAVEVLRDLADSLAASEIVHIQTCNRVEVVYARAAGHPPEHGDIELVRAALGAGLESGRRLRFSSGRAALRHLFRVVSSLDSLVLGEDQILAQVRAAYGRAREVGMIGPMLENAFEHAFQVGKQVRTKTDLSLHAISVMSLGVQALAERIGGSPCPRVALVGAGVTARHAAKALDAARLPIEIVVNRSLASARDLARECGARAMELAVFRAMHEAVDVLVSATGAPGFVFDRTTLAGMARRAPGGNGLLALDLALPRDLEPGAHGVELIDLEALRESAQRNRALRSAAAAQAEELVERRLFACERKNEEKHMAARIAVHVAEARELLGRELEKLARQELAGMGSAELSKIERWARSTFGRMTHLSTATCRDLAHAAGDRTDGEEEEETTG